MERLTPRQACILLTELKVSFADKYGCGNVTDSRLAKFFRCSPPAIAQWKSIGIGGSRLQEIFLSFPDLKFWKSVRNK